ncbi:ribosome biogenesis protein BRX1 [Nematocida sp. AWRm78]|nr:ribosome biogenesis protein BRX1 [Nematocida sp. AWRm79]KAI5182586.1 ribosome biogenesis protein BRX1 [Nematocida sp. AWRm78]
MTQTETTGSIIVENGVTENVLQKENTKEVGMAEEIVSKEAKKESSTKVVCNEHTPRRTLLLLSLKAPGACRQLVTDLISLLPENTARDSKLKDRFSVYDVADIAEMRDAENALVIETRKKSPAPIMWAVSKNGATEGSKYDVIKFMLTGVYTMSELKFIGNPLANTQMTTLFTEDFEKSSGLKKAKNILSQIFNTTTVSSAAPTSSMDYVDKIASFFILDNTIHVRFYHIQKKTREAEKIIASRLRQEQKMNAEKKEEEKLEEIEANNKPDNETEVDPNIEAAMAATDQVPWYEIHECGPRFTLHPRESDLDDNYTEETQEKN